MKTIEHYIEALSLLPEKKFFEIARNFLGNIQTPYNKRVVIDKLISFLKDSETQDVIFSFITHEEALLLNAIDLFDFPSLEDIDVFFGKPFYTGKLSDSLVQLQERLLVYTFTVSDRTRFALNPVFEERFKDILRLKHELFPAKPFNCAAVSSKKEKRDNRMIFAFFVFLLTENIKMKVNGDFSKAARKKIDVFFDEEFFMEFFDTALHSYLIRIEDGAVYVNLNAVKKIFSSAEKERRILFAASMVYKMEEARLINALLDSIPDGYAVSEMAISRFLCILYQHESSFYRGGFTFIFYALKNSALILPVDDAEKEKYYYIPKNNDIKKEIAESIIFNSTFSYIMLPDIDVKKVFPLLYFSVIENIEEYKFEITKESVVNCYKAGKNADYIIDTLNALTGNRTPAALIWALKEWEERFNEVFFYEGCVLYVAEKMSYVLETDAIKPFLLRKITDNVFIVNSLYKETVLSLLAKAGVSVIGGSSVVSTVVKEKNERRTKRDNLISKENKTDFIFPLPTTEKEFIVSKKQSNYKKDFAALLETMEINENEKREIVFRNERGLIVSKEQLKKLAEPGTLPYEKLEAHGLDYAGKLNLAKNAYVLRYLVEITWKDEQGEKTVKGAIMMIDKRAGADVLSVLSESVGYQTIPISKITLLRRIKRSIFE